MSWMSIIIRSFTIKSYFLISIRLLIVPHDAAVEGSLVEVPEDQTVRPGGDVVFRCRTQSKESVDWQFQRQGKAEINVFIGRTGGGGDMSNGYVQQRKRIHVKMIIAEGQYDLVIRNITASDEGVYSCSDISDPSVAGSASLSIVGEGPRSEALRAETCRYDAAALNGNEHTLSFRTSKTRSIQLEHRSTSRSYPLHVFRDGKIVNDYYALSGRFSAHFDGSTGKWNLLIRNVQMEDAGTYIFSEENGLGDQQHREIIVIRKRDQQNTTECEKNCTVYYSGHCPPRLEWRLIANEADNIPKVLRSKKTVHSGNAVSVKLEEPIEESKQSRPVCSLMVHSEDQTSDITIQVCNFSPQHLPLPYSQPEEPASKVPLIAGLTVFLILAALAVAVVIGVYKREKLRKIVETKRKQSLEAFGFLWGLIMRQKTTEEMPSIVESPQRTKDVLLDIKSTPIGKLPVDEEKVNSIRRRTPHTESAKKTMIRESSNRVRNSSSRKNLNNEIQNLQ